MKNNMCVNCNSEEIRKGVLGATVGEVYLYPEKNLRKKPSSVSVEYCRDCGCILSFNVDNPNSLE
jgi:NMD protein affecting ribosome stability and mRNA decay